MEKYIEIGKQLTLSYGPKVLFAIITFIIGWWIAKKVRIIFSNTLKRQKIDETVSNFFISVLDVVLKGIVVMMVANIFGIETTSFVALLGAVGFGVGLALQGSLGHLASGILLLFFKPYKVGDWVKIGEYRGYVEEIQVFNTIIKTEDSRLVIIPNGSVTSNPIINLSTLGEIRVEHKIPISDEEDISKVFRVVKNVLNDHPKVLKNRPIEVYVCGIDDGKTILEVMVMCKTDDYFDVFYDSITNIKKEFLAQGIKGPDQNFDIHLHK